MSVSGKRVAVLVEDGFEDSEVSGPVSGLTEAGVVVTLVGPHAHGNTPGSAASSSPRTPPPARCASGDFDALVIPGGYAPDRMRMRHAMVDLTRTMAADGKPVAAICHGPQLMISAGVLRGRTVTCWPSIAIDVTNAGGLYVDRPVVARRQPDHRPGSRTTCRSSPRH